MVLARVDPAPSLVKMSKTAKKKARKAVKEAQILSQSAISAIPALSASSAASQTVSKKQKKGEGEQEEKKIVGAGCKWSEIEPALSENTMNSIKNLGFENTTPVQQFTIPLLLTNKDVVVQAATGSGKTVAFLVPAFELLAKVMHEKQLHSLSKNHVAVIVIAPTRELVVQIFSVAMSFAASTQVKLLRLIGGTPVEEDIRTFRSEGGNIVIASPGRLDDVMKRAADFYIKELELLILDEADRLLDMGFQATLNEILARLPKQRRTGLFSATMTSDLISLARAGLRNPRVVRVATSLSSAAAEETNNNSNKKSKKNANENENGNNNNNAGVESATPSSVENLVMVCPAKDKFSQCVNFLRGKQNLKIILYVATCACVDYYGQLFSVLKEAKEVSFLKDFRFLPLHGQMVQKKRTKIFESFRALPAAVLICTDVAARGIDLPDVHCVVQLHPPSDPSYFVHRVGRTGRMGREGMSIVFLDEEEDTYIQYLSVQKVHLRQIPPVTPCVDFVPVARQLVQNDRDLFEKSQRAFVSYVRGYKEHICNFIFRLSRLDIGGNAYSFCLLLLPKMAEINTKTVTNFSAVEGLDVKNIKYKKEEREQARLKRNEKFEQERKDRDEKKRKADEEGDDFSEEDDSDADSDFSSDDEGDDEDDFSREAQAMKRMKKGKLSKKQFEKEFDEELDSDLDDDAPKKQNNKDKKNEKNNNNYNNKKRSFSDRNNKRRRFDDAKKGGSGGGGGGGPKRGGGGGGKSLKKRERKEEKKQFKVSAQRGKMFASKRHH